MNTKKTTTKKIANRLAKYAEKEAVNTLALRIARDAVLQANEENPKAKVRRFSEDDVAKIREFVLNLFHAWDGMDVRNAAAILGEQKSVTLVQAATRTYTLGEQRGNYRYAGDGVEISVRCHDCFWFSLSRKTVHHQRKLFVESVRTTRY